MRRLHEKHGSVRKFIAAKLEFKTDRVYGKITWL